MSKKAPSKMRVINIPQDLSFVEYQRSAQSVYYTKLSEALRSNCCIEVLTSDAYVKNQFKSQAKKMGVLLLWAKNGENTYIKPVALQEQQRRILLFLREPRSVVFLQGQNIGPKLDEYIKGMEKRGLIRTMPDDRVVITEQGKQLLKGD